jgi:adenine-specific DNA-methyltransferase
MIGYSLDLFGNNHIVLDQKFPSTRYQGSKYKLTNWIKEKIQYLDFDSVLDGFGGTGSVSFLFKTMGKKVYYNDYLKFNSIIGKALIENNDTVLSEDSLNFVLQKREDCNYKTFIADNFEDIYFTNPENQWLDIVIQNILQLENEYEQAIAFFAIYQSCIIKRPYNLFHRKNLYVRTAEIKRSFGNKKTWDTEFEKHFRKFVAEANNSVFNNYRDNISINKDIFEIDKTLDLVYFDPPYISKKGVGVNYLDFYHFLEGMTDYYNWDKKIDILSNHKKLSNQGDKWSNKTLILDNFKKLIAQFQDSIIVISYRDDGIPSVDQLIYILEKYNKKIEIHYFEYQYVLSNSKSQEVLIIAK